jgi:hypothetical protein
MSGVDVPSANREPSTRYRVFVVGLVIAVSWIPGLVALWMLLAGEAG